MFIIDNSYRVNNCPFCNSERIRKTGDLKYSGRTEFSTHFIDLSYTPQLFKCKNCNSSFTQNVIPPKVAEDLYGKGEGSKRWSPKNFREDKTTIVQVCLDRYLLQENTKVLDVGCNTGEFLDYAKLKGAQTYGLEICEESCVIVGQKGHVAFRNSMEINQTFDVITAFDVVEHLYDPNGFISFLLGILNEKGFLIILTGNPESIPAKFSRRNWWYYNYPEHVIFPNPSYFKNLPGFDLIGNLKVYASKAHEEGSLLAKSKATIRNILSGKYAGQPVLLPDHQLVILQKKSYSKIN